MCLPYITVTAGWALKTDFKYDTDQINDYINT